jgi:Ion transport protein/Cyclic nucleotide-binding domain
MNHITSSSVIWKSGSKRRKLKAKSSCVLVPDSKILARWNIMIITAMMYSIIITPYEIAFDDSVFALDTIEYVVDGIFFIDIIMTAITGYYDEEGSLVTNRKIIFYRYLKGWFFFDLLACFPTQIIESNKKFNYLTRANRIQRLFKMIRLAKVLRLIKIFRNKDQRKYIDLVFKVSVNVGRLAQFLLLIVFMIHSIACFWIFIAKINFDSPNNWIFSLKYYDYPNLDLYIVAIYWTVTTLTTVGYGDITATNSDEKYYCSTIMIIGILMYSYTVSSISNLISTLDSRKAKLKKKLDSLNHISIKYRLSSHFEKKIALALEYEHKNNDKELEEILSDLPSNLKQKLLNIIFKQKIYKNFFFVDKSPGFTAWVVTKLRPLKIGKKEYIFKENEFAAEMYFIIKGKVTMMIKKDKEYVPIIVFSEKYYFGEVDLLFSNNKTRLNTVYTEEGCELLTLSRENFEELLNNFEDEAIEICIKSRERFDRNNKRIRAAVLEMESKYKITTYHSIPNTDEINLTEIKNKARESIESNPYSQNNTMYKNIIDLKKPENNISGIKKRVKRLDICVENITALANELSEFILNQKPCRNNL